MALGFVRRILPSWQNALLAVVAAVLLVLAFPDFEYWFLAWFALVPLMWAVEREKVSTARSFVVGWLFGTVFFFGTCWWLTFAPITYAGFPPWLAYSGMVFVAVAVGLFPALFAGILSVLLRRFGSWGFLAAAFVWVFTEFLRYWVTGNNWNAVGYSQAPSSLMLLLAPTGGVLLVSFACVAFSTIVFALSRKDWREVTSLSALLAVLFGLSCAMFFWDRFVWDPQKHLANVVAIQPNVPMSGLSSASLDRLRQRQTETAESAIKSLNNPRIPMQSGSSSYMSVPMNDLPITVILPESPMNYMYEDDREFQKFINDFARRNNVSVLFNSAEPDATNGKYFNSAVMVGPQGSEAGQYDKIYLLPFGEAVPPFLEGIVPGFVGNFSYGREYDLLPVGDAKAGVMICFESHFGQLSRRFVADGADVIIEMTNDGYLGPTPVLRQHLANAVFRAVETNRPILRVTNVGITAYITEKGAVLDATSPYQEDTRVWTVSKSDGSQTFYVKYGDWFAWLCTLVTVGLLILSTRRKVAEARA